MGMASRRSRWSVLPETAVKLGRARKLAARGLTLKAIAKQVKLSESTLRRHQIKPQPAVAHTRLTRSDTRPEPAVRVKAQGGAGLSEATRDTRGQPPSADTRRTMRLVVNTLGGEQMQISAGDFEIALDRTGDGWRCADRAPAADDADIFEQATRHALLGGAIARAVDRRVVKPEHADVLAAHVVAADSGQSCDDTADGAQPIAFAMAAIWTLNQIGADLERRWADGYGGVGDADLPGPPAGDLIDASFVQQDPLRSDDSDMYVDTCVERAMRSIAGGTHIVMEHFPIERLPEEMEAHHTQQAADLGLDSEDGAVTHNSPAEIAQRLGIGSVVGGDLGFLKDAYEAHAAAGTGVYANGAVVVSAAHRLGADTPEFQRWAHQHLSLADLPEDSSVAASKPHAVGGVLDTAFYGSHDEGSDTNLAVATAATIAETLPDLFDAAVQEFYAYGLEQPSAMLAPFTAQYPQVAARIQASL